MACFCKKIKRLGRSSFRWFFQAFKVNAILRILLENLNGLQTTIERVAREDTARYILQRMPSVQSVDSPVKVMDIALARMADTPDELVCEFGVYQGTSITYLARRLNGRLVFGFDSFEGLPEAWRNCFDKGTFAVKELPKVPVNVTLVKGWFDQTLPVFLAEHPQHIALLHMDCDLYSSASTVLTLCAERLRAGTVIVFDEYFNYPGWQSGEFKAFQEFVTHTGWTYQYLTYNHNHEQVAVILVEKKLH